VTALFKEILYYWYPSKNQEIMVPYISLHCLKWYGNPEIMFFLRKGKAEKGFLAFNNRKDVLKFKFRKNLNKIKFTQTQNPIFFFETVFLPS
jgi:hypothetical protein